jgi:ParB family chromosome partitioning protein
MPIQEALGVREARADKLLEFDDAVVKVVAQLKEKGLTSPYLKNFVVARVNFLRFVKGDKVPDFDDAIDKMAASVAKIDPGSVKKEDLARMGGAPAEADEE